MATLASSFQNIARAVSAYSDQEYTDAVRIGSTALVGTDARINVNAEDYYGTIRWDRTLGDLNYGAANSTHTNINYGTETDDEGAVTEMATDFAEYIKSIRNVGANQFNVTQLITQRDGAIAKVGRDFGITRARDFDAAIRAIVTGVVTKEAATGTAGNATNGYGQDLGNPLNGNAGFYYDINGPKTAIGTAPSDNTTVGSNELIDINSAGGKAAKAIFAAMGAGFGDLEPDFMYLNVDQETYYQMRIANLLDEQDRVTDGNIVFDTLLQGKIRLIVSRQEIGDFAPTGAAAAGDRVNKGSTKTSLLFLPGAISAVDLPQPNPVELDRDASLGTGAGKHEAWYRWGYVLHPRGYTWAGSKTAFATNATYDDAASWTRKETPGNLGILPIFHS